MNNWLLINSSYTSIYLYILQNYLDLVKIFTKWAHQFVYYSRNIRIIWKLHRLFGRLHWCLCSIFQPMLKQSTFARKKSWGTLFCCSASREHTQKDGSFKIFYILKTIWACYRKKTKQEIITQTLHTHSWNIVPVYCY